MKERKLVKVSSFFFRDLLKSIFISFLIIFIVDHFGAFKYENWAFENHFVTYESLFGNKVYSDTNIFTSNKSPIYGEVDSYLEKLPYYSYAVLLDFIPLIITIIIILSILIINRKYQFKIV
jgi:hypothetical protein